MSNSESNFRIMLQAMLDKVKSIANIKSDIKAIEPKLPKVKIQGKLDKTATQKELNSKIKTVKPKVKVDADTTQAEKKIKKIGKQKNKTTITPTVDNTQVVSGLKQAQKETKTLWERFTSGIIGANLVRMAVQRVTQAIRETIVTVKELDAIKTNIQMVSGTSDPDVNAMMSSYNAMAKELSSTTKDVAESANEFLRMGESVANTNELIRSSQVLSKVGMIESSESASYLISSLKGYQVAAEDSMDIVSKLTSVDLEAAVSAGGLAEALSKCANIANNSGVTMDRLIGYTATVGETTQKSMSEVGNSFQALLSRMNNIKIGRFIDDETGESLSDTEAVLNKLGIQLRDTENTYRSFDDVLDDVGSRWESFTKVEQNALSVAIAGTRQRENFEALMNNWGNALKYSEISANSAGSALERYGVYQDSIEAKTNELTAAMESLSTNVISEELYSGIIEATKGLVEFLDNTNLLKASLAGLVALGVSKVIVSIGAGFITAAKSTAQLSAAMALFNKGKSAANLNAIGAACKGLSSQQLKLVLSTKDLTNKERLKILAGMGVEKQERKQMLTTLGFAAAEDKATFSTFSLKYAFKSLWTTIAANPIGLIVTAVTVATMVFTGFNRAMEEVRQKAKDLGDSFKTTKSDIEDYKSQIGELYSTINDSSSSIEDVTNARKNLMSVQDELIDKFGTEKETIDLITQAVNNQTEAFDRLTKKQWQETKNEFNNGGFWNNVANWGAGYKDNMERMVHDMENAGEILSFSYADYAGKNGDFSEIKRQMEQLGWVYEYSLGGYVKEGNLESIYSDILKIQNLAENFNAPDKLSKDLTKSASRIKNTLDDYGDMWDMYILQDRIFADEELADSFKNINDAYAEYQTAFASGDEESIVKAQENFADILTQATEGLDDQSVIDYFNNMYPALQSVVSGWQFNVAFDADTDNLQGRVQTVLDELKDKNGRSLTAEEILGLGAENKQYQALVSIADSYNMTLEEMIELLKERKLVSAMDYDGLVSLFGKENVDKLSSGDLEIAYQIKNVGNMTFEELQAEIQKTKESIKENVLDLPFTTILSQFQSLTEGFEQLDKIYTDIYNKEDFDWSSILNNEKFTETFGEMGDSYDSFIKTVSNAPDDLEACQSAFDELVTSYIYSAKDADGNSIMGNLTEETKEATAAMLEQMGAANALEIVEYQLKVNTGYLTDARREQAGICRVLSSEVKSESEAKYLARLSTMDLQNATYEEIQSLVDEAEQLGITSSALLTLKLTKMGVNDIPIDTREDINNLLAMADAAGIATKAVGKLAGLKAKYEEARDNGRTGEALAIAAEMQKAAEEARNDVLNFKPTVKYEGGSSYKSAVDKAKSDAEKASKEAADTAKDQVDSYMEYMKASLEAGKTDYRTYADEVSKYLRNMFDTGKISAKEYHDYVGQMLETQKSILDRAADAVTKRLDKEIDSIKEKMDGIEENYNSQIEYLDTVIEYHEKQKEILQDENDELDRQKALEEALYNLQRAQNQRTIALYTAEKGKIYVTDVSAVRDAEDDARKAKLDIELAKIDEAISKVEKQQDALKEAMDTEKEQLQVIIDRLEEYKKQWSYVADEYENIQNDMLAKQILGADYESQILDGRLDVLNDFKNQYIAIQKAIIDEAWESTKAQLEAAQAAQNAQSSSTSSGTPSSNHVTTTSTSSKPESGNINNDKTTLVEKWYIYDVKTGQKLSGAYNTQAEAVKDLNKYAAITASHQVTIKKYASGTKHAQRGLSLVGEEGTETFIDNDGNVSLVTEPSLINMEGGETVIKASETEKMLDNAGNLTQFDSAAFAKSIVGNLNFTMDEWRERVQAVMPSFADMVQLPEMRAPKDDIMAVNRDNNITVSIGDIHLHEVQNVDGFAKAIIRELPNRVIQNLGKR